jgi:DNA modification methylase
MIEDRNLQELHAYRQLERNLPLCEAPELGRLVIASDNEDLPIHRWFRFKEGYSGHLLSNLLSAYFPNKNEIALLDPFCGMGTTLLSAQTLGGHRVNSIGVEYNPFIRFAAATKLSWPAIDAREFLSLAETVIKAPASPSSMIPELSGLTTGRCMSHHTARRLIGIRDAIRQDGDTANHKALLLGLAASIEPLSRTRKDGRALRLVERDRQAVAPLIRENWQLIVEDVQTIQKSCTKPNPARVISGDGRKLLARTIDPRSIDLVLTSPPYLNNIDYSEVYKLELWLMDFIRDADSFLQLRKGTLRSHPTSELSNQETEFLRIATQPPLFCSFDPILTKLDTETEKWRRKLFAAYFSDIMSSLKEQYLVLADGGLAVIVIGNSLHGGQYTPYVIATDLLICELAKTLGFVVEKVSIARALRRRLTGNHFLRESIVVLRKPNAS